MSSRGLSGHQTPYQGATDEWLTPPEIIKQLGTFDLDPCCPAVRPWDTALHHYCLEEDGLSRSWFGRVWLNPPYGPETGKWLSKLADHGDGIALIFARTETAMFFKYVWERASAIMFLRGRLYFHRVNGERAKFNSGAPSCLVAYGRRNVEAMQASDLDGVTLQL